MIFIEVALDLPLPQAFDYQATDALPSDVGRRVLVPFGRGEKIGLILAVREFSTQPLEKIKPALEILRNLPPMPADWLALCQFCASYYHYPLGQVIGFALPPLLRRGKLPSGKTGAACLRPSAVDHSALPVLLPEQDRAVQTIVAATDFAVFLLYGITGSGKTEVYLRAIAEVLANGGQALMLVPEIALTPQLEQRVASRFQQARIVAAHSGLTDARRARGFVDALHDDVDIVLGTRLSVFMPLPRLRLIVIDEEHDASFKQQDGLRYSARDVAIFRAKLLGIPVVLGSATPALETWRKAQRGQYQILPLTRRAKALSLPQVRTVDTRRQKLQDGLCTEILAAIRLRIERREQSLIFLNRRGYAPVLACPACAWISRCHRCAANMVLHVADQRLRCHHCGLETHIPRACPDCGNQDVHPFGRGTQRLEIALQQHFPEARVLRIDRDSASTPQKWQAMLTAIDEGGVDILVGTQMLAKGHDFPRITLVGVAGADAALFAADFRAPERLFAQLLQVGGRSGRAELPGEALIQTEYPQHPLYQALREHDYASFANAQLAEREAASFPPFSHHALLRAEAREMSQALNFLATAKSVAHNLHSTAVILYDPVPMRLSRLMNLERAQLLVESVRRSDLQLFLADWIGTLRQQKMPVGLRWHLDIDPLEM